MLQDNIDIAVHAEECLSEVQQHLVNWDFPLQSPVASYIHLQSNFYIIQIFAACVTAYVSAMIKCCTQIKDI